MKRGLKGILAALVLSVCITACSKQETLPVHHQELQQEDLEQLKAFVDEVLLDEIRSTGQPFDWNSASNDWNCESGD